MSFWQELPGQQIRVVVVSIVEFVLRSHLHGAIGQVKEHLEESLLVLGVVRVLPDCVKP